MSFLINALGKQIITMLENELINNEPVIAQALWSEAQTLFGSLAECAEKKLHLLANPAPTNVAAQPVESIPEVIAV